MPRHHSAALAGSLDSRPLPADSQDGIVLGGGRLAIIVASGLMDRESFAAATLRALVVLVGTISVVAAARQPFAAADVIPLRYDKTLIGLGFPSPLLRAMLRGRRVWFIVDT
jgi:hypothetical protein